MKSKLFAVFVTLMMFMISGTFGVYAEDEDITENFVTDVSSENYEEDLNSENNVDDLPEESTINVNNNVLTIDCHDNKSVLSGMDWKIFKVAERNSDNAYINTDEFENCNISLNNLSTSQIVVAAETLEAYAEINNIQPLGSGTTDAEGIIKFSGLSYGMYLLSGSDVTINGKYYLPAPSLVTLTQNDGSGIPNWSYNVTAMPKLTVLGANNRVFHYSGIVKKIWENDDEKTRPKSIDVTLAKDGEKFKTVTLSEENNWTYTFEKLSSKYKWTVIEEGKLDGYSVTYSENNINVNPENPKEHDIEYIIVNRGNLAPKAPTPQVEVKPAVHSKQLPQTGQLWWPVPAMSALGLIVFAAGWKFNSHKRKKYEK